MKARVFGAIVRKDSLSLLPLLMLTAVLFAGDVFITRLELLPVWGAFRDPVLQLTFAVLALSLIQLDSPASVVDDWLCRPVPRADLLAAKLLLLLAATYLSRAGAVLVCNLVMGASIAESLLDAVLLQDPFLPFLAPLLLFIAMVTRTLVQAFGLLIAIFVAVFVMPTPLVRAPGPLEPAIGAALPGVGMGWLAFAPATLLALCLLATGCGLIYWRRRIRTARILLAVSVVASLLIVLLPMWLLPFKPVFAAQAVAAPARLAADTGAIYLRQMRSCLPATRVADLATDPAFAAARKAGNLDSWDNDQLEHPQMSPGAIAFLTSVEPRRLPLDWRAKLNYVAAEFASGEPGLPGYSLRPARYNTDVAGGSLLWHAWLLPEAAARQLKNAPDATLTLRYFLTLLAPRHHDLPLDGQRHALPGLGYCSARLEGGVNRVQVDCFSASGDLAQISAELTGVPSTRTYGPLNLAPRWMRWFQGQRASLSIGSARLLKQPRVTVTAWSVGGYVEKSLTSPGILGGDSESCPLPQADTPFQQTLWRDTAAHEVSSVSVAEGVQLEVLDFGGNGSPVLLLPGLGATAHSFDEFAPLLAKNHRVIAMTRRGAGFSSKPDSGYDTERLAQDVLQVMDALGLEKVTLIGHSIAGDELTWLGGHHPGRFRALVYLDAAYDRSQESSPGSRLRELGQQLPPEPPIPPAALANHASMVKHLRQRGHLPLPEGELIAFWNADKPFLAGSANIEPRVQQALVAQLAPPAYGAIKVPALALYALEAPEQPLPPWYDLEDSRARAAWREMGTLRTARQRSEIANFRQAVPGGQVIELPGASHYLMQSNAPEVLDAIEQFLAR